MRTRLAAAPPWVLGLISGSLFGAAMTLWASRQDGDVSWTVLIVLGVLAGGQFGVGMGVFLGPAIGGLQEEMRALPEEQRRAVLRSATRGPAPADPVVREAALRRARRNGDLQQRPRFRLTFFTLASIGYALLAITQSPWWWVAFAMFTALLAGQLVVPRRIARRIAVLSDPPSQ